jgi:ATP-dependent Clp protease adaptor protein ClpS
MPDDLEKKFNFINWRNAVNQLNPSIDNADYNINQVINNSADGKKRPPMYDIVLSDNAKIPDKIFELVIDKYLNMSGAEINKALKTLRSTGSIVCGVYTREVAEVKVINIINFAYGHNQQIKCTMQHNKHHVNEKP